MNAEARERTNYFAFCPTSYSTAAKTVTVDSSFSLVAGATVTVKFTYYNTASSPTLNVNNTGAKYIRKYGTTSPDTYYWISGACIEFVYDGTDWVMVDGATATTTYYGKTKLSNAVDSTSQVLAATPYAVKQAYDKAVSSSWKLLWTNASPSSDFAAQTLTISGLSGYNLFCIIYRRAGDTAASLGSDIVYVPGSTQECKLCNAYIASSKYVIVAERTFTFNKTGGTVAVTNCARTFTDTPVSDYDTNNTHIKPMYILGTTL